MKHLNLIYLDVDFMTAFYEEMKGIAVPTRTTKSKDANAGFGLRMLVTASVGATMREQKEYPLDAKAMFVELRASLEAFPQVDLLQTKDKDLPEIFWVEGVFGMAQTSMQRGELELASTNHFQFMPKLERNDRVLNLIQNDTYFSSGYDQLSRYGQTFASQFAIPARLLVRLIFVDKYYPVSAPLLIIKTGNDCE